MIGYGWISGNIDQFRNRILDIELLREASTELRKKYLDLSHLGAYIRLKRKFDQINLTEE
jgi:hypothetical protein